MRYIKIKIDVPDENYIFLHRKLKMVLDEALQTNFYHIHSYRFVEDG